MQLANSLRAATNNRRPGLVPSRSFREELISDLVVVQAVGAIAETVGEKV